MFMPEDISQRIMLFIDGKLEFPFITNEELMGTFFIFGKNNGVYGEDEILVATDLAKRTILYLTSSIYMLYNSPNKLDSFFIRENYTRRFLEICIECDIATMERKKRVAGDPIILTDCFATHIAYHKQDQFFEIFQPFKENQLPLSIRCKLKDRMLLLGYNVKGLRFLPYESAIFPFLVWLKKFDS